MSLDGGLFVNYVYDDGTRLTTITRGSSSFGLAYDNANRRTSMSYPNGVITSYGYDSVSRLLNLTATSGSTTVSSATYTYDAASNRASKTLPEMSEAYSYDLVSRLGRVERAATPTGFSAFGYDAVGNRTSLQTNGVVSTSAYNDRNEPTSETAGGPMLFRGQIGEPGLVTVNGQAARMLPGNGFEATIPVSAGPNTISVVARDGSGNARTSTYTVDLDAGGISYSYDLNGNLASKSSSADTWTYFWDAQNRLKRVEKNAVEVARFAYDALGRRVEKVAAGITWTFTYDGQAILREGNSSIGVVRYVHGPGIDEPLAREEVGAASMTYYHADGLGSVIKMTNATATVVLARQYDAWGNLEIGADQPSYAFTAREWDPETGLYYYRARYYDPKVGRFISEDPIRFAGGVNFYAYVSNRPVTFGDPYGLWTVADLLGMSLTVMADWIQGSVTGDQTRDEVDVTPGLDGKTWGGSADAYRHCLIRCRLDSEMSPTHGLAASAAHEIANTLAGQPPRELMWDWWNYNRGAQCAAQGAGQPGGPSCQDACMGELIGGALGGNKGIPQSFPDPRTRR